MIATAPFPEFARPTLLVLSGYSGSGKSTLADRLLTLYATATVLRSDSYHHCYRPGQDVTQFLVEVAAAHLRHGVTVIVDAVNRHPGDRDRWHSTAMTQGVDLVWIDLEVPHDECVRRDSTRPTPLGEAVLRTQRAMP